MKARKPDAKDGAVAVLQKPGPVAERVRSSRVRGCKTIRGRTAAGLPDGHAGERLGYRRAWTIYEREVGAVDIRMSERWAKGP
jgi:hypothetical protein